MNSYLSFLDRWLKKRGERVQLIRTVGSATQTRNRVKIKAIVKDAGQVATDGVASFTHLVTISPTDLRRTKWPGGRGPATISDGPVQGNIPDGHRPGRDFVIPTTTDKVFLRGREASIVDVNPVQEGEEITRIEIKVAA